jgi:mannose-6-phosphate isomerase/beta-glucosidase
LSGGKPRELHIDKSVDVIKCPHVDFNTDRKEYSLEHAKVEELVTCQFFSVKRIQVKGKQLFQQTEPFTIISVIEGQGNIDGTELIKGDNFILPAGYGDFCIDGNIELIISLSESKGE